MEPFDHDPKTPPSAKPEKNRFLWVHLTLTCLVAAGVLAVIYDAWRYRSFAGFGSLLVLFFMLPCLALLAAEAFLVFLGILRWKRCAMAADILQILSGVLAVRIMVIDPEFFVGLAAFIVLMVLGIIGLLPPGRR